MTNKEIINEILDEVVEAIKYCEEQFNKSEQITEILRTIEVIRENKINKYN